MTPTMERRLRRKIRDVWLGCAECSEAIDLIRFLPCEPCVKAAVLILTRRKSRHKDGPCRSCGHHRCFHSRGCCISCYHAGRHLLFPQSKRGRKAKLIPIQEAIP